MTLVCASDSAGDNAELSVANDDEEVAEEEEVPKRAAIFWA